MNFDLVLEVLPNSKEDAKSTREIAQAMGLDVSSHTNWIRTQSTFARVLRILIKWCWASRDYRRDEIGKKFWHNT